MTLNGYGNISNRPTAEIYGMSNEVKPTDYIEGKKIVNGSVFIEIDTGKGYLFDENSRTWNEV